MRSQFITLPYRAKNITGQRFGRLTTLGPVAIKGNRAMWLCRCDCGNEIVVSSNHLKTGNTKSCGCLKPERASATHKKHGLRNTPEYEVWAGMRQRCTNPNHIGYPNYGGRGISVCERWGSFENFIEDMGQRPGPNYTIDRVDNDGDYEPDNCRWIPSAEQQSNTRSSRIVTWQGQQYTLSQLASEIGISMGTLRKRLERGMSIEQAANGPVGGRKSNG